MREPASYRDPSGVVFRRDGVVYRQVNRDFAEQWELLRASGLYDTLASSALLLPHEEEAGVEPLDDRAVAVIRPRQIDFISYPYEWSFSQLKDAALVTLTIQERALDAGMTLKDASAYNIQFVDGRPILIDSLSFEGLVPGEPWVAYRQFCQHFLAPLAAMAYRDVRLGLLLRPMADGLPLDLTSSLLPGRTKLRPGLAAHLHLHARAEKKATADGSGKAGGAPGMDGVPRSGRRVSDTGRRALLDSLRRTVEGLRWKPDDTTWSSYTALTSYSPAAAASKARLVEAMISRTSPGRVWDIGANTGTYSAIAAATGRPVIALDADAGAIERLYLATRAGEMPGVAPFVVNLVGPSPAIGWALEERRSLVQRGPAPTLMALALIHHLAIGANVPLPLISSFFATIGSEVVVEFVPKEDPQARSLLLGRRDVFPDYSIDGFRSALSADFELVEEAAIDDSRRTLVRMRRLVR
jgi:hypothetical protein